MGIGIWGDVPKISQLQGSDKVNKAYKSQEVSNIKKKSDEITISKDAKDISMITKALKEIPDIREDKVNEIIQRMDEGTYTIDENLIADKIMQFLNNNSEEEL